ELAIPMATLLGVMLAFSRLSGDSELVVLRASGISLYQLLTPIVPLALLLGGLALIVSTQLKPWGHRTLSATLFEIAKSFLRYAKIAVRLTKLLLNINSDPLAISQHCSLLVQFFAEGFRQLSLCAIYIHCHCDGLLKTCEANLRLRNICLETSHTQTVLSEIALQAIFLGIKILDLQRSIVLRLRTKRAFSIQLTTSGTHLNIFVLDLLSQDSLIACLNCSEWNQSNCEKGNENNKDFRENMHLIDLV
ncbi:MAG: LptF/LptG family permease, partial [Planctomycetes bacterium]|nr:LptF/LptG family permease [Planctomycetota bacterium]